MDAIEQWSLRGEFLEFVMGMRGLYYICGQTTNHHLVSLVVSDLDMVQNTVVVSGGRVYKLGLIETSYRKWVERHDSK